MRHDPETDLDLPYSTHAKSRRAKRCKRISTIRNLYRHFDRDIYVRRGVWAWSITRSHLDDLVEDGVMTLGEAERLANLVVLVAENDNEVVTVIRGSGRRIGRYYRRHS
jgi:hypothetical protein